MTLLTEHRRLILCGPSGTGKSYLAARLGAFMVMRRGVENVAGSVATVTLDDSNKGELEEYLHNLVGRFASFCVRHLWTLLRVAFFFLKQTKED